MFAVFRKLKPLLYHNTYKSVPISVFYRRIKVLMQIFMILMYSGPKREKLCNAKCWLESSINKDR